jgi:hypothetical protein
VFHEQPSDRLRGYSRRCPGRTIAEGDFAGVGEARFERGARLSIDYGDFMPAFGELKGRRYAHNSGAKHNSLHTRSGREPLSGLQELRLN